MYEKFTPTDQNAYKITQNARNFGIDSLSNTKLVQHFLNSTRINLTSKERENLEKIFTNLMKIEDEVQLSK